MYACLFCHIVFIALVIDISKDGVKGRSPCGKVIRECVPEPIVPFRVLVGYHPSMEEWQRTPAEGLLSAVFVANVARLRSFLSYLIDNQFVS
jgi:hypothetical protein